MLNIDLSCFHGSGNEDISKYGIIVTLFPGLHRREGGENNVIHICCLHTYMYKHVLPLSMFLGQPPSSLLLLAL